MQAHEAKNGLEPYVILTFKKWKMLDDQARNNAVVSKNYPQAAIADSTTKPDNMENKHKEMPSEKIKNNNEEEEEQPSDSLIITSSDDKVQKITSEPLATPFLEKGKQSSFKMKKNKRKKDLSRVHGSLHIQRQLDYLTQKGHFDKKKFPNLASLVQNAMGQSKAELPNEKEFYTYLFAHHLGHFVRNRSKISKYYHIKDWFVI